MKENGSKKDSTGDASGSEKLKQLLCKYMPVLLISES